VRWYRGPEGDQRIWYEAEEIEQIAEDELQRAGLTPEPSSPVTDLERFIESHLGADLDQYAELDADVLGLTRFDPGQRPAVSINKALTESAENQQARSGVAGRWRATLGHEASHVLFHRYLFDADLNQPALFDPPSASNAADRGLMRNPGQPGDGRPPHAPGTLPPHRRPPHGRPARHQPDGGLGPSRRPRG